jgi:hypothetical protein
MNIATIENYIQELVETKYVWWREGDDVTSAPPFYAENAAYVDVETVKKGGANCAGFVNLICRFVGTKIPGIDEKIPMAGGTYAWFSYLKEHNLLQPFDPSITYPFGTIVLRDYVDEEDQGHITLVISNGQLAHSGSEDGIHVDESVLISHNWIKNGYYTHVCLPQDYLFNPEYKMKY